MHYNTHQVSARLHSKCQIKHTKHIIIKVIFLLFWCKIGLLSGLNEPELLAQQIKRLINWCLGVCLTSPMTVNEVAACQNERLAGNKTEAATKPASIVQPDPTAIMFPCGFLLNAANKVIWCVPADLRLPIGQTLEWMEMERETAIDMLDNFDIMSSYAHLHADQCDPSPPSLCFSCNIFFPEDLNQLLPGLWCQPLLGRVLRLVLS